VTPEFHKYFVKIPNSILTVDPPIVNNQRFKPDPFTGYGPGALSLMVERGNASNN